jgi:hypothetical protein
MKIFVEFGFRTFGDYPKYDYDVSVDSPDDDGNICVTFRFQEGNDHSAGILSLERNIAQWLGRALTEASRRKKFEKSAKVGLGVAR